MCSLLKKCNKNYPNSHLALVLDFKPKIKGIMHGIPLDTDIFDIEKELQVQKSFVDIKKVFRLQKFDKIEDKKTVTQNLL